MTPDLYGLDEDGLDGRPFADINVTPLVDVMLVLLVVFMMAAPLMVQGVPIDLPKGAGTPIGRPAKPLVVSLARDGGVYLRDERLTLGELAARLKAVRADEGEAVVYVRADRRVAYGEVMDVVGRVGEGGYERVSLLEKLDLAVRLGGDIISK